MLESKFQSDLIKELEIIFEGCVVLKNDPTYIQGFPDLLLLYNDTWVALEVKRSINSPYQPNQEYYLDLLNNMSYAWMICPQNREEILDEMERSLKA